MATKKKPGPAKLQLTDGKSGDTAFVGIEGDAGGRIWALSRNALWIISEAPVVAS